MADKDTKSPGAAEPKNVVIVAKKDGFRRMGLTHPSKPVTYKAGVLTKNEIAFLKSEPLLTVTETDGEVGAVVEKRPAEIRLPATIEFPKSK